MMRHVGFGFLGTSLDRGFAESRWDRWRPTVALMAHPEILSFSEYHLLINNRSAEQREVALQVIADIKTIAPECEVVLDLVEIKDPWDFEEVYLALQGYAERYQYDENAEYWVHLSTGSHVMQLCLFMLTEARWIPARIAETQMDKTRLAEGWRGKLQLIDFELAKYAAIRERFSRQAVAYQATLKDGIPTRNLAFNQLMAELERVCLRSDDPLLLTGPTGAGKSKLAQQVHALRREAHRVKGKLVEVNCATLRGDNAMSTLFGHVRGAFTGAQSDRSGLLREAHGGMLFLDEIGELGLDEQAMLLRAIEDKRFMPMGSDKEVTSSFQLVTGTNRDLQEAVANGTFRADLLARINQWQFTLPGLADRIEDLEPNIEVELAKASAKQGLSIRFAALAREQYLQFARGYAWPGNFRDLSASISRMATLADGGLITSTDVQRETQRLSGVVTKTAIPSYVERFCPGQALDAFDRVQLETVLKEVVTADTLAEAGRALFAESRQQKANPNDSDRIRKYLARFGLDFETIKARALS